MHPSLSLFHPRASSLASKLLLTIKADPDIKGYRAPPTRNRYVVIQHSNRIRGISCRRDGESLPSSLKSVFARRVLFGACVLPATGRGMRQSILISSLPAVRTARKLQLALSRRSSRMCEWIGMPLGFCTRAFIVRLSGHQGLSRDDTAPTSRGWRGLDRRI